MNRKGDKSLIVGLDIGTSKVVALVGEVAADGTLEIVGIGTHPSRGLKKGVVVNIESTVQSIQQALKEAEMMADCKITRVYTGITGSHIRGQNSTGMVIVRDKEVTPVDVTRVVETAKAINIPNDQRLLLVEPQDPQGLAAAIGTLLTDPARAAEMGRAGRERRRREFSIEGTARAVEHGQRWSCSCDLERRPAPSTAHLQSVQGIG